MFLFNTYAWFTSVTHIGQRYFIFASITFIIFYILFRKQLQHLRIQKIFPKPVNYYRDIFYSVISIFIFATVAYVCVIAAKPYNNVHFGTIGEFGIGFYIAGFVWMLFLHDTYFYWMHRVMHHPKLFRYVHLVHHKSTNPSPWTAYAFHPLEAVLEAGIIPLIAFTIPVHKTGIGFFMLFQIIYNVYGHLGYELFPKKFLATGAGRLINTGTAHNGHHKYFTGNYGLYTLLWDRWMGTVRKEQKVSTETAIPDYTEELVPAALAE